MSFEAGRRSAAPERPEAEHAGASTERAGLLAVRFALREAEPHLAGAAAAGSRDASAAPLEAGRDDDARRTLHALGDGRPLPSGERVRMERRLGADLGGVRLHTDDDAARVVHAHGASALSVGEHVAFGAGRWRPETPSGDYLLAHELAHMRQPAWLPHATAERGADAAAFGGGDVARAALAPAPAPRLALRLNSCFEARTYESEEQRIESAIVASLDGHYGAPILRREAIRDVDRVALRGAMARLKLRPHPVHTNYYRFVLWQMRQDFGEQEWSSLTSAIGINPLEGAGTPDLPHEAVVLFIMLKTYTERHDEKLGHILEHLRGASPEHAGIALGMMRRAFNRDHGNELHHFTAEAQKTGTGGEYRELVRFLHSGPFAAAIADVDPDIAARTEEQRALVAAGTVTGLTESQMKGMFATRGLELAYTMLRESEGQLIKVLGNTEEGASTELTPLLDADADRATATINRFIKPQIKLVTFEQFAAAMRPKLQAAGRDAGDEALQRIYNRQRQIAIYQISAKVLREIRSQLKRLNDKIEEHREWFRTPKIIAHTDFPAGPAPRLRAEQRIREEAARRNRELNRLIPQRDTIDQARKDVESVAPLLGGLSDEGLDRLVALKGGGAEFDQLLRATLARIFANIGKARAYLQSGEVSVWLLPPVVAATRRQLGIAISPEGEAQKHWATVVESGMKEAKAREERVHDILEIFNVGALIVALGAAVFTGGGSIALYVGVAGTGLAIGQSVYDLAKAYEQSGEQEAMYGSALTDELRLSEIPPDYRAIYRAWVGLGINVALAALHVRSIARSGSAALRGQEAAVRAEAERVARQLRASGATASEADIVEAIMRTVREEGWIAGSTRGATVYELGTRRALVGGGASSSLEAGVEKGLVGQPLLGGAKLSRASAPVAGGPQYVLEVANPGGGAPILVEVEMRAAPAAALPAGAHGAESGPARLQLTYGQGKWKATVHFDERLHPRDVPFAGGHELDEIASVVQRNPKGAIPSKIAAETQANVFKPGPVTGPATGHDLAQINELQRFYAELPPVRPTAGSARAAYEARLARIDRALESMGLRDPTDLGQRITALKAAGVKPETVALIEQQAYARRELAEFLAAQPVARSAALARTGSTVMDEDLVRHLMFAEERKAAEFVKMGIRGGHHTGRLQAFLAANPQFAIVEDAVKAAGGNTYRRFAQYRWTSGGAPPLAPELRPGGVRFNAADWERSLQPKTTVDNFGTFLQQGEDAWTQWRIANPSLARTGREWGRGLAGSRPPAVSADGVEFSGFFEYRPATATAPEAWRIETSFVEASWF